MRPEALWDWDRVRGKVDHREETSAVVPEGLVGEEGLLSPQGP